MATNDDDPRNRIARRILIGLVVAAACYAVYAFWTRPPQMGVDEEVFRTVDALYTAVRARDAKQLAQCESRLKAYRDTGKLPASAASWLEGVIATARGGDADAATRRLYDFMAAQRK
jgi:hypothetical protein